MTRLQSALLWDHNAYYHALLLRQLPPRCDHVLEVGCGAGGFAAKLGQRSAHVDAVDRSPVMIEAARRATPRNVRCIEADAMTMALPAEHYDAVVSISALHHLPLEPALRRLSASLRPGGVLAAVALPRTDLPRELPVEAAAGIGHRAIGLFALLLRRLSGTRWLAHDPMADRMPVLEPVLSVRDVRRRAEAVLPNVRVRRLVFWRYLLVWAKP